MYILYIHQGVNNASKHTSFEGKSDIKYNDKRKRDILISCEFNQEFVYGLCIKSNICVNGMLNVLSIF
jgi:hypothetical protein